MGAQVLGMLGLSRALTELIALGQAERAEPIMNDLAQELENKIKARYPVTTAGTPDLAQSTQDERVRQGYTANDPRLRSGAERDAITHSVERDGADLTAYVGIPAGDPTAPGALANEFGTVGGTVIPPRPIFGPALQDDEQHIVDALGSLVRTAIKGA